MTTTRQGELIGALPARLSAKRPKGEQLEEILEGVIATLPPGSALPSERLLARRYGVARATASQAIEGLAIKGLVYRVHGSGTFVAEPKFSQPEMLSSFSEDMHARGMTPGSVMLRREVVSASGVIARQLEIEPGGPVVTVERVRTADGEPMALERAYLPAGRFPGLEAVDLTDASLYESLTERFGVQVAVADQWVSAIRLSDAEARLLDVPPDQPAILFQRVTRDPAGEVVEYSRSLYRGDRYEVHTRHRRPGIGPEPPRA
jgi:GntR family transcriptional regulator